ncbi:OsmC family protein [Vicingaceae bacterium]|nr:OsmC family protein [Vicingaceae bacterium]MDC1451085.1 OsmC family protein [Vicingaceae bacterium]
MGVKIKGKYAGELRYILTHQTGEKIQTDAPLDNHGKGEAFSPTDLVAAALGSCMLTIIAIRAETKSIKIGNPSFSVFKEMNTTPRRIKEIQVEISLPKELNNAEKNYLETEARKCPVALSINSKIEQNITFTYV